MKKDTIQIMDRVAAYRILCQELEKWRSASFAHLAIKIGTTFRNDLSGSDGVLYTVEISPHWSNPNHQAILVHGRIDNQSTFRFDPLEEQITIKKAVTI